eukprot:11638946-Alexandrium_andersonii.AAC.1
MDEGRQLPPRLIAWPKAVGHVHQGDDGAAQAAKASRPHGGPRPAQPTHDPGVGVHRARGLARRSRPPRRGRI